MLLICYHKLQNLSTFGDENCTYDQPEICPRCEFIYVVDQFDQDINLLLL
jgi:hypothetical protein